MSHLYWDDGLMIELDERVSTALLHISNMR